MTKPRLDSFLVGIEDADSSVVGWGGGIYPFTLGEAREHLKAGRKKVRGEKGAIIKERIYELVPVQRKAKAHGK